MKALKFDIYGKYAHFKNPESNIKIEVSYENIPKTTLVGALGAMLGLRGRMQAAKLGYIEYWEELKDIQLSIIPGKARWRKHIDELVNSTGFANEEAGGRGGNQIVRKQILEDVRWTIYISEEGIKKEYWDEIQDSLIKRKSKYPIYLGKTGFVARFGQVEVVDLDAVDADDIEKCDSLVCAENIVDVYGEIKDNHILSSDGLFSRRDYMPVSLDSRGLYLTKPFVFTNSDISAQGDGFYKDGDLNLYFI